MFLVGLYFLWEASSYRGLYAFMPEWQFQQFGHYFPILNFSRLVMIGGSPAIWILRDRRRGEGVMLTRRQEFDAALTAGSNFRCVLLGFSGGFAVITIGTLLWALALQGRSAWCTTAKRSR